MAMDRFEDIIGQDEAVRHLQTALKEHRISHSYIIHGDRGSSKKELAMAFAAALLCEQPENGNGIVRTNKRLARAAHRLKTLRREIRDYYFRYLVTPDTLELRNLAVCAELIVKSAQKRHESRGLHYTLDWPRQAKTARQTIISASRLLPVGFRTEASTSYIPMTVLTRSSVNTLLLATHTSIIPSF